MSIETSLDERCLICEELSHYGKETEIIEMLAQGQYFFQNIQLRLSFVQSVEEV